jgi:S-disulfanyl-L-cysteine oxidoreductase SoxD
MSMRKPLAAALLIASFGCGSASADSPGLGKPISEKDLQAWNVTTLPDGSNMPPGSGTAAQGAKIYAEQCAACHGESGKGGVNAALVGSPPLDGMDARKTIANFWGYPTTVFDYIRRAMPWPNPRTLSNDEVYALCAYVFALNKLIGENDVMNAESLPKVKMPNRDNFIIKFPDRI